MDVRINQKEGSLKTSSTHFPLNILNTRAPPLSITPWVLKNSEKPSARDFGPKTHGVSQHPLHSCSPNSPMAHSQDNPHMDWPPHSCAHSTPHLSLWAASHGRGGPRRYPTRSSSGSQGLERRADCELACESTDDGTPNTPRPNELPSASSPRW